MEIYVNVPSSQTDRMMINVQKKCLQFYESVNSKAEPLICCLELVDADLDTILSDSSQLCTQMPRQYLPLLGDALTPHVLQFIIQ
jgi:hypothetical protein